jgi:hypothetical protein
MGICDDFMAEPFHRFRAEERARVQCQLPELAEGVERLVANHRPPHGSRPAVQPQATSHA